MSRKIGERAKNTALSHLAKTFARMTQPHLSKMMNRTPAIDWREDSAPRPPHIPFNKLSSNDYVSFSREHKFETSIGSKLVQQNSTALLAKDMHSRPYRILCLDGGGVRGVLTNALLMRIVEHQPRFLDSIDLICGTSAGGLLSLLLASGYSASECDEVYRFAAPHIFGYNPWRSLNPFRARYSDKAKQEILTHYYGESRTMMDLKKTCAIVAFSLDGRRSKTHSFFNKEGWRPAVFSNMPRSGGLIEPDSDLLVWDAAMRTSAAPTFFPVFKGYTDGGIVANNPSIIAVSKAMAHYPFITTRNVAVLSLGAGSFPRHTDVFSSAGREDEVDGKLLGRADWGIKQWIPFLLDLLLDGDSVTTEMVMNYLLGSNGMYHRLDPVLPRQIALDDVTALNELKAFAYSVDIAETLRFVDEKFSDVKSDSAHDFNNSLDHATNYHEAWEHSGIIINKNKVDVKK